MQSRSEYLQNFEKIIQGFDYVGITPNGLAPGEAELGFLIPRTIFENLVQGFSTELKVIDRVIGIFSEVVTGKRTAPELRQLSTTDPMVVVTTVATVAVAIGGTITWILDTQERNLRVRQLKEEAKKTGHPEEGLRLFDQQISEQFQQALSKKVDELIGESKVGKSDGRREELSNGLRWAIDSILARIERGMTVEIRFLPPTVPDNDKDASTDEDDELREVFDKLAEIRDALTFPPVETEPTRHLPPPEPPKSAGAKSGKKS